eukprot:TRINITY_DN9773_c0_g1_i1.p1 TRINITY_DN9773_c0_g1~~TRINITY_DN9773_c0_g1_i1.p1  ORF type:complete len:539 (-),score=78.24 TRINITY_DN9773_c0_g1_i1:123-1739(-)
MTTHRACTFLIVALLLIFATLAQHNEVPSTDIGLGETKSGELTRSGWLYYRLLVSTRNTFSVSVVQPEDTLGDCDLYILNGTYPNKQNYYARDISVDAQFSISITEPHSLGYWYIGVYAFQTCKFSLTTSEGAAGSCSGHGKSVDGVCRCTPPYYGDSCSEVAPILTADTLISDTLDGGGWNYYYVRTAKPREITVRVVQEGDGDTDLYVSYGKPPTLRDFDYRDISLNKDYTLSFFSKRGFYYFGIYAYPEAKGEFRYQLSFNTSEGCPLECSHHGQCLDDECFCQPAFEGEMCETMVPSLRLDHPVRGHCGDQAWNEYHIDEVDSNSNLVVSLTQADDSGDCDLFIRGGAPPTVREYDYADISSWQSYNLTVEFPGQTTWFIGVLGYRPCTYSLVLRLENACPNDCSNRGTCQNGHCVCEQGAAGPDCSSSIVQLNKNEVKSSKINRGQWVYFSVPVSGKVVVASVGTEHGEALKLYAGFHSAPTQNQYQFYDNSDDLQLVIRRPDDVNTMIFGIYGSAFEDTDISFKIIVWSSPI